MGEMEPVVDLNDLKVFQALRKVGTEVIIGETDYWQIADEGKKGYSWILNTEDAYDGILDIIAHMEELRALSRKMTVRVRRRKKRKKRVTRRRRRDCVAVTKRVRKPSLLRFTCL